MIVGPEARLNLRNRLGFGRLAGPLPSARFRVHDGPVVPEPDLARQLDDARAQALSELAAGVAHEINNPLSGVLNYALLAQRYPAGDPRQAEALEGILSEARRIQELTRALLTYTRRAGDAPVPFAPIDLVRAALAPIRRQLREELVQLAVEVPDTLPAVNGRGHELQLVLLHLLTSARSALAACFAGRDPAKTLTVRGRHEGEGGELVVLEVERGGPDDPAVATEQDERRARRAEEIAAGHGGRLERPGPRLVRLVLPVA